MAAPRGDAPGRGFANPGAGPMAVMAAREFVQCFWTGSCSVVLWSFLPI